MRGRLTLFLAAVASLVTVGCGGTVTLPKRAYDAANTVKASGSVSLGEIFYVPAASGKYEPNRLYHDKKKYKVYLELPVVDYMKAALTAELIKSGVSVASASNVVISATIAKAGIEQNAFSLDTVLEMQILLSRDGIKVESGDFNLSRRHWFASSPKRVRSDLDEMVAEAYATFMLKPDARTVLK